MVERDEQSRRRRWWLLPALIVGTLIVFLGWFDRSEETTVELGTPSRIIVINDAGPVSVSQGDVSAVTRRDSWVLAQPSAQIEVQESDILIRVLCPGRTPCRSAIDLQVTGAPDLVIIADGFVDIDRYEGKLTVFSTRDGVALGPLRGSVRVVANDSVTGAGLDTDLLDISAGGDVDLWFDRRARRFRVQILGEDGVERELTPRSLDVDIGIEVEGGADRSIAIRTNGDVRLRRPPEID